MPWEAIAECGPLDSDFDELSPPLPPTSVLECKPVSYSSMLTELGKVAQCFWSIFVLYQIIMKDHFLHSTVTRISKFLN